MKERPAYNPLDNDDWDIIIERLKESTNPRTINKCILFLGPEALISNQKKKEETNEYKSMIDLFCDRVLRKMEKDGKPEFDEAKKKRTPFAIKEKFLPAYGAGKGQSLWKFNFNKVYQVENLHPVFIEKLPYCPFPIIVNTSPDELLRTIFTEISGIRGTQYSFFDYKFNSHQNRQDIEPPDLNTPVIYNLFGSIKQPTSIVSSPEDLLEYVFSLISNGNMDDEVLRDIRNARYLIFLGFDFESWHLKLLMRFFYDNNDSRVSIEKEEKGTYAHPWKLENQNTQEYFKKLFNVTFIENNIVEFIEELYEKCNGIRRTIPDKIKEIKKKEKLREELLPLIKKDELELAFDKAEEYAKEFLDKKKQNLLYHIMSELSGAYNMFKKNQSTGETYVIARSKAREAFMDFITDDLFA